MATFVRFVLKLIWSTRNVRSQPFKAVNSTTFGLSLRVHNMWNIYARELIFGMVVATMTQTEQPAIETVATRLICVQNIYCKVRY